MRQSPFITTIGDREVPVTIGIYLCDKLGENVFDELVGRLRTRCKPREELEYEVSLAHQIVRSIRGQGACRVDQ